MKLKKKNFKKEKDIMLKDVKEKAKKYTIINDVALKNEVAVFGSTYLYNFPFYELMQGHITDYAVYNRSIEGMKVSEAAEAADDCLKNLDPAIILISLGEEDDDSEETFTAYSELLKKIKAAHRSAKIYVMQTFGKDGEFCDKVKNVAERNGVEYVEVGNEEKIRSVFSRLSAYFHRAGISFSDAFGVGG